MNGPRSRRRKTETGFRRELVAGNGALRVHLHAAGAGDPRAGDVAVPSSH